MKKTDKLKSLLPLDQIEQGALDQIFDNLVAAQEEIDIKVLDHLQP